MRAKAASLMKSSYSDRFQNKAAVESYESGEYAPDSYSSFIWDLEKPALEKIIFEFKERRGCPIKLLDFACGTGRILSAVETLVESAEGVDISEAMIQLARGKCHRAVLRVGNILADPGVLQGPYDVITCFRFILNVESEVRRAALVQLKRVLRPDGLLIASVHGNSKSLRHPAIAWKRWCLRNTAPSERSKWMLNELSLAEARTLFDECGFEIVDEMGFGMMPPTMYRTPLRGVAAGTDRFYARKQWMKGRAIDLLFICRPKS
jgi:SAM-dependent methyltransferase